MDFKKERNFIVAYDGSAVLAKWNISTGEFIGKSGKVVKNCPPAFTYNNLPSIFSPADEQHLYGGAVGFYRCFIGSGYTYTEKCAKRFEEMLSVGLVPYAYQDLETTHRLTKDLVAYIKEHCNGRYESNKVEDYLLKLKYKDFLEGHPAWFSDVFFRCLGQVPIEYLKSFLLRAEREHVYDFWDFTYHRSDYTVKLIINYYKKCNEMYGSVKIEPNLLSNYAHINALYVEYSEKHYNEVIKRYNDQPFLYFEYGDYEARPILTKEAFHQEATAQGNCVERLYMGKVHNGETYIVTVRRKDSPDTSLITCEVSHTHQIYQYLTRFNKYPTDEGQLEFRQKYAEHLAATI